MKDNSILVPINLLNKFKIKRFAFFIQVVFSLLIKGSFTYSDCDSDVAKNRFIAFPFYYSHLAMVNITERVVSQSQL